jgi:23S rRNA (adenine2503-C2)-methyltransferase
MEPIGGTPPRASIPTPSGDEPGPPDENPDDSPDESLVKPQHLSHAKSSGKIPSLFQLLPEEFAEHLVRAGHERYRGRQILDWVYNKRMLDPLQMSNVSRPLRESLRGLVSLDLLPVTDFRISNDGEAAKLAIQLENNIRVESVAMRSRRGVTLCLSSQAGCGMGCTFCATGTLGLARNLRAHEIVSQVLLMLDNPGWEDPGYNLVFMGMGEPLANYIEVMKAIRIFNHPEGLSIGARRITVSTVGLTPQMRRLAREGLQLGLALSLHATTDEVRNRIVPLNARYPIREIVEAAIYYAEQVGRRVTLEYVLLAGVNDSRADALRLGEIARAMPSKVNLIPYNPVPQLDWERPSETVVQRFVDVLLPRAPSVTVRRSQGRDVWAACGQLGSRPPSSSAR